MYQGESGLRPSALAVAVVGFPSCLAKQSTAGVKILGCFLFGLTLTASGQTPHHAPKVPNPGDKILGSELVLWTPTQQPKPLSEVAVAKTTPGAAKKSEGKTPENAPTRSSITEDLVGEVVKTGETYALTTPESETYILDNPNAFEAYEGELVKIVCEPNPTRNLLHFLSLDPHAVNRAPKE